MPLWFYRYGFPIALTIAAALIGGIFAFAPDTQSSTLSEEELRALTAQERSAESASAAPSLPLQITSEPAGASIQLGPEVVGRTPLDTLLPGKALYHLTIRDGSTRRDTLLALDDTTALHFRLAPDLPVAARPPAPDPEPALAPPIVTLSVRPWGDLFVDGLLVQRAASVDLVTTLPPGRHEVAARHPQLGRIQRILHLKAGRSYSVVLDFTAAEFAHR